MFSRSEVNNYIAELLRFDLAHGRQPGTWYKYHNHVYGVGFLAQKIAEMLGDFDSEKAWVLGVMHDAGKMYEPFRQRFHGIVGYELFIDKDVDIAKINLSHSFYFNKLPEYEKVEKMFFGKREDYDFAQNLFVSTDVSEYDKLIQLCDCLVNCNGFVTLQQRADEFAMRNNLPVPMHLSEDLLKLKEYFDYKLGCDIYSLYSKISSDFMLTSGNDYK